MFWRYIKYKWSAIVNFLIWLIPIVLLLAISALVEHFGSMIPKQTAFLMISILLTGMVLLLLWLLLAWLIDKLKEYQEFKVHEELKQPEK